MYNQIQFLLKNIYKIGHKILIFFQGQRSTKGIIKFGQNRNFRTLAKIKIFELWPKSKFSNFGQNRNFRTLAKIEIFELWPRSKFLTLGKIEIFELWAKSKFSNFDQNRNFRNFIKSAKNLTFEKVETYFRSLLQKTFHGSTRLENWKVINPDFSHIFFYFRDFYQMQLFVNRIFLARFYFLKFQFYFLYS